ncbi:MAG: peptide deformylase [Candidatus Cloacimonetes bacterium]|nr:peptide deformylase [Candidatus Cloacimonadota bacterium]
MRKNKASILPIRIIGDKILRQKAREVDELNSETRKFIEDLTATMYEKDGVGLAAPQTGKSLRIFVVDPYWYKEGAKKSPFVFINPRFKEFSGEVEAEEGCLSLPDVYAAVKRAEKVVIEARNEKGENFTLTATGIFARALQHEYDHLDGILFIDKVPKLGRVSISRKIRELKHTTNAEGENIRY